MKEIIINNKNENQRLDKYLFRLLPNATSSFIYKMCRKKNITLNGKKCEGKELLKAGDSIKVFFSDETFEKFKGESKKTDYPVLDKKLIVFEDENILIMNKPKGMLSQKAEEKDVSACEYLLGYLIETKQADEDSFNEYKPSAVNRLDRNTTGLLVCAKNLRSAQVLSAWFKDRSLKKEYLTIVKGKVIKEQRVKGYLTKNEKTNVVKVSNNPGGTFIETSYTPVKYYDKLDSTLLNVELHTGKTHQIRAHLSSIGYPIMGDHKYGDEKYNLYAKNKFKVNSQLLHSFKLTFPKNDTYLSYLSGKEISVLPDFYKFLED